MHCCGGQKNSTPGEGTTFYTGQMKNLKEVGVSVAKSTMMRNSTCSKLCEEYGGGRK